MIVTLTLNTALDHVLFCDGFEWGRTIRAHASVLSVGCKGADVAWMLAELGQPVVALGWIAGENGRRMEAMLRAQGVATDFVWVEGETRLNTVLIDTRRKVQSTVTAKGMQVRAEHVRAVKETLARHLEKASCLAIGGSLPPGLAKRDDLPPGLEKQLVRKGHLPPGLEKHIVPFPPELERRLPPLPPELRRGFIAGRAIIFHADSRLIFDVFVPLD